jgi:D-sedoheptulose 7-phosphate isomerase
LANGTRKSGLPSEVSGERDSVSSGGYVRGVIEVLQNLPTAVIDDAVQRLFQTYQQDRTVYLFGNGGSAALASHAACDLGKGTSGFGDKPFRAVSLTDNIALMTAWANDTTYENVFAAQLRCFLQAGDIAFAISGSGNSPNVIKALSAAREIGAFTIGLTGFHGGKMKPLCDLCITVPSENMQHIEDCHLSVMHAVFLAFCGCIQRAGHIEARGASL